MVPTPEVSFPIADGEGNRLIRAAAEHLRQQVAQLLWQEELTVNELVEFSQHEQSARTLMRRQGICFEEDRAPGVLQLLAVHHTLHHKCRNPNVVRSWIVYRLSHTDPPGRANRGLTRCHRCRTDARDAERRSRLLELVDDGFGLEQMASLSDLHPIYGTHLGEKDVARLRGRQVNLAYVEKLISTQVDHLSKLTRCLAKECTTREAILRYLL